MQSHVPQQFRVWLALFTPLRYQATQADCYPTCMLNALIWLFERHELPGAALQRIYACCLDGIERGLAGSYTSEHAGLALANWLGDFKTATFAVDIEVMQGRALHLGPASRVVRWLRSGGVAVLDVYDTPATTHSILALAAGSGHIDFWDPYQRGPRYDYGSGCMRLTTDGRSPNLRLAKARLDSPRLQRYCLGPHRMRSGVLVRRHRRSRS